MATATGRVTLAGRRLIVGKDGEREETEVAKGELAGVLEERFGLVV